MKTKSVTPKDINDIPNKEFIEILASKIVDVSRAVKLDETYIRYKDKSIGYVDNIKFINGLPHYDIVITDEETIRKIEGKDSNYKTLSLGYKKL